MGELGEAGRTIPLHGGQTSSCWDGSRQGAHTPSREAEPFSVFFSWGAGRLQLEADGKQMCRGGRRGKVEGSQGIDAAQVRAPWGGEQEK